MIWIASTQRSPIAASAPSRSFAFQRARNSCDVVAEPGARELVRVRVDDGVVEEVLARELGVAVAVGDAAVHVGEDLGVAALAHLLDAPRHDRRRAGS